SLTPPSFGICQETHRRRRPPPGILDLSSHIKGFMAETKRCPKCRQDTLLFTRRWMTVTATPALARTGTDPHDGRERLSYVSAWVCSTPECDYRELIGDE